MIHLGYLGYNETRKTAFVPNEEIRQELTTAVESKPWNEMVTFQQESDSLLDATLDMDGATVAAQIEKIHNEYVSVILRFVYELYGESGAWKRKSSRLPNE